MSKIELTDGEKEFLRLNQNLTYIQMLQRINNLRLRTGRELILSKITIYRALAKLGLKRKRQRGRPKRAHKYY